MRLINQVPMIFDRTALIASSSGYRVWCATFLRAIMAKEGVIRDEIAISVMSVNDGTTKSGQITAL